MSLPFTSNPHPARRYAPCAAMVTQRGISLFIAMVTLVLITLAGIALVRSVDTGVLVAGNLAFKEATHSTTSVGIEDAATYLTTVVTTGNPGNANLPAGCANAVSSSSLGTCRYYARRIPPTGTDTDGIPFIDWTSTGNIPPIYLNGSYAVVATAALSTYQVQNVIERLCTADMSVPVVLNYPAQMDRSADRCHTDTSDPGGSKKGGSTIQPDLLVAVKYRVTTRVTGPRNAVSITQTVISY